MDETVQQIIRIIMRSRRNPAERRQLLKQVVKEYGNVEKTGLKLRMGNAYLGLRAMGDTHAKACRWVADSFKVGVSTVEHCVAPTRHALLRRALSEERPSVAKLFNTLANAGKRKASPKRKLIPYAHKERRRPRRIVKNERESLQ